MDNMDFEMLVISLKGIIIAGLLTIVFVILKFFNIIHWSWLWVLSPILLAILGTVFIIISIIIYTIIMNRM